MAVILAGATGLVGGAVAKSLPQDTLTIVTRRAVEGLAAHLLIGAMDEWPRLIAGQSFDLAICCLGTTIKQAGSKEAFAAVDLDGVMAFAAAARSAGARQFMMVSSVGAQATASNFYLKTKGQAEAAVQGLGFVRVDIFRPGLLRGNRTGPARIGESLAMSVSPLTDMFTPRAFDKYRSIAADTIAKAICALAGRADEGVFIHHNRDMLREATAIG
jgi:uncharacterized protein YbjT (DUF2867 family)